MAKEDVGNVIDKIFAPTNQGHQDKVVEAEDVSKIIKEWLDPKHIDKKTRYTPRQVIAVTILQSIADTYDIKTLKRFLKEFKKGKLSEGGQSASELTDILKFRSNPEKEGGLAGLAKFLE